MATLSIRDLRERTGDLTVALAAHFFDEELVSLGKAAQLAGMGREAFTELLAVLNIPVIRTDAVELERDLAAYER